MSGIVESYGLLHGAACDVHGLAVVLVSNFISYSACVGETHDLHRSEVHHFRCLPVDHSF